MATLAETIKQVWRDFSTYGLPATGVHDPVKAEIRALMNQVNAALTTLGVAAGGAITVKYATLAELAADLDHDAGTLAIVYDDDGDPPESGIYAKAGATGTGSWDLTDVALPAEFADDIAEAQAGLETVAAAVVAAEAAQTASEAARDLAQAAAEGITEPVLAIIEAAGDAQILLVEAEGTNKVAAVEAEAADRITAIGAAVGSTVYADTTAGLAATADQGYFWVVGTGDAIAKLYKDNAGTAVLIAESPSQEAMADVLTFAADLPLSPDGTKIIEYALDGDGASRVVRGINPMTGAPVYPGLVTDAELATEIEALEVGPFVGSMPLALNGEVPLVIFGSDRRALTINPTTGLLTPAQAAAESGDYDSIFPSDARLLVSDYWSITEQSPTRLRFLRGITNGNAFQHCSPGSRVGFYTNAQVVRFRLYWNGLVTRDDVQNFVGGVLVDDVLEQTFTNAFGASGTGEAWETVDFGSASTSARKVELIWPYGDGMDLLEVQVSRGAAVIAAPARPTTKLVVAGDSITHGFNASNIFTSWAWQLAVAKGYQLINVANGSELVVAANANVLSETGAQHVIYAIGYNNFVSQTATATFQASLEGWLANARAELPDARLYVSSMLYTPNTNTITPAQYRTATEAAVTAFGDGNTEYVNGLSLMTNSSDRLADTIHPNDTGAAEVATAWASIID